MGDDLTVHSFKVTIVSRRDKRSIFATSFEDLVDKAREIFNIGATDVRIVLEYNGTIVGEEHFQQLEKNLCLMILKKDESWERAFCEQQVEPAIPPKRSKLSTEQSKIDYKKLPTSLAHTFDSEAKDLRKKLYVAWSNTKNLREFFREMIGQVHNFFEESVLELEGNEFPTIDVLNVLQTRFIKKTDEIRKTADTVKIDFNTEDYPVSFPIHVEEKILIAHNRTSPSSGLNTIGCQHLNIHNHVIDSSTASESKSENSSDEGGAVLKKLKVCQKAKWVPFRGELLRHRINSSVIVGNATIVDVLVFCSSENVCHNLATYLGLIFLEDCLVEAGVTQKEMDDFMQTKIINPNTKVYRLVQSYVCRKLVLGYNNVCLTASYILFRNVKANAKAAMFSPTDSDCTISDVTEFACFTATIEAETNFLKFMTGISEIISAILHVKSYVNATFCKIGDSNEEYYVAKFPLLSVIPFYILKFFSQSLTYKSKSEDETTSFSSV